MPHADGVGKRCPERRVFDRDAVAAVKGPQAAKAVDQQGKDSILAFYKDMMARRKASAALTKGTTTFISLPEPVLAFTRTAGGETLTCVFNLSPDAHVIRVTGARSSPSPMVRHLTRVY